MKLSKGIVQVILANIINLIISVGNGFLLPKFLSVESYAALKTFLLYTSYIGILHLGYIDGVYMKYGGKAINEISSEEFASEKKVLALLQLGITIPLIVLAAILGDACLLFAAISVLPINMVCFFKFVYQATGEFKEYRYITNISTILIFVLNVIFLFAIRTDNSLYYIGMQVAVSFIIWIYYERKNGIADTKNKLSLEKIWNKLNENVHLGIIIMLGNFMGVWIASIDRWFVMIFFSVAEFAYYSFAVTMLRLINVVITAFSVTLYNFFCKNPVKEEISRVRKSVVIVGAGIITVIFPLNFVIQTYLEKYVSAVPIIRVLFMAQFILIGVNAIYLNLYKALNLQKKYLIRMLIITITAVCLNGIIGYLWKNNIMAYAVATLLTSLVWLVLCQIDLPEYKMSNHEWLYLLLTLAVYLLCSYLNVWIGMVAYVGCVLAETLLFFPKDVKLLLDVLNKKKMNET